MRWRRTILALVVALAALLVVPRLLWPLPPLEGRTESAAIPASEATALGRAWLPQAAASPGLTGVRALPTGPEAFSARVMLIRQAEESVDAQYYIWQDDATGALLLDELRAAAERGVRVRLLLDDNGIAGLDAELAGLDALEAAEVRLWNPFTVRGLKAAGYLWDFPRLNRRMHNKSLVADGVAGIVGGRNVGDVYFAYGDDAHYVDMDALVVGPAAAELAAAFDAYWASGSAYPAALILLEAPDGLALVAQAARAAREAPETAPYAEAVMATRLMEDVAAGRTVIEWVPATVIADDPAKGLGEAGREDVLLTRLLAAAGRPARSLDLVSAYFVPGAFGVDLLGGLVADGVAVRVLTNAWEATDVALVHAGYARRRPALLAAGVELLELRSEAAAPDAGAAVDLAGPDVLGASAASLHAKTLVFDGARTFIGSFNFDPRSARINTEMGVLIESEGLARAAAGTLDGLVPGSAYRVLRGEGGLAWEGAVPPAPEPKTTALSRTLIAVAGRLPIEWLL